MCNSLYHVFLYKEVTKLYKKYSDLLKKHNKTNYSVSKDTGIAQSVLSDWKLGKSNIKVDKLITLSKYFNVPITYFLEETKGDE